MKDDEYNKAIELIRQLKMLQEESSMIRDLDDYYFIDDLPIHNIFTDVLVYKGERIKFIEEQLRQMSVSNN